MPKKPPTFRPPGWAPPEKRKAQADERRGSSAKRGYGYRWQKARLRFLKRNPLCCECQHNGHAVGADVVDHIVPHKGNQDLFWDQDNWQPLCKMHHDRKTAQQDGGFGRH